MFINFRLGFISLPTLLNSTELNSTENISFPISAIILIPRSTVAGGLTDLDQSEDLGGNFKVAQLLVTFVKLRCQQHHQPVF